MRSSIALDATSSFGTYAPQGLQKQLLAFTRAMPVWEPTYRFALSFQKIIIGLRNAPVDMETFGCKIRFYPQDNVSERRALVTPGRFDPQERDRLARVLSPGGCFIDIGANCGLYSLALINKVGPSGLVIAIEPQKRVHDRLLFNRAVNGFENLHIHNVAVSDVEGELILHENPNNCGEATLSDSLSVGGIETKVRVRPLLDIVAEEKVTAIDALKIDIEGHEDHAMMPFITQAPDNLLPKVMVTENSRQHWKMDWVGAALSRGYKIFGDERRNIILERG